MWHLRWADTYKKPSDGAKTFAEKVAEKTGKKTTAETSKPPPTFLNRWYLDAFFTLNPSRQSGMGIGYIPFTEIASYANNIGHIEEDVQDFVFVIQAMDSAYVEEVNRKKKK